MLVRRWEPSLRMTPDQALKHAWIHDAWNFKPRPRAPTLRKFNICFPSEARKDKVQRHHHLGKKGTAPQIASSLYIVQGSDICGGLHTSFSELNLG